MKHSMNVPLPLLDDLDDRIGREAYDTPEDRLKNMIVRFGEAVRRYKNTPHDVELKDVC